MFLTRLGRRLRCSPSVEGSAAPYFAISSSQTSICILLSGTVAQAGNVESGGGGRCLRSQMIALKADQHHLHRRRTMSRLPRFARRRWPCRR